MTDTAMRALQSMAASSAMEGLPLSLEQIETVQKILDGTTTLEEFLASLTAREMKTEKIDSEKIFKNQDTRKIYFR